VAPDILRVVVILLRAFKVGPQIMQLSLLVVGEASFVHLIDSFSSDMLNVSLSMLIILLELVFDARSTRDLLNA